MEDHIRAELEQEEQTEFHKALLQHVKALVDLSRSHMRTYHDSWDRNDEIYRGIRSSDKQDDAATKRDEPIKMVVPLSYSQVQTFVAFCISLFTQREKVFELIGKGEEDHRSAKIGEALLERDLQHNNFEMCLYQVLLDISRFGLGIVKTCWVEETEMKDVSMPLPGYKLFGVQVTADTTVTEMQRVIRYQGNKLLNISPYNFYPDVRLPISRFQEGEFCASEDTYSRVTLKSMERDGQIAGLEWVRPWSVEDSQRRGTAGRFGNFPLDNMTSQLRIEKSLGVDILTECQVVLVPSEFEYNGVKLGEEDYPQKWNVWYVNDQRVVKAEPMNYAHNQFTYDVGEYSPDMHKLVNEGLSSTIDMLQSVISWFINSHIMSVRKVIGNRLIVDPSGVEMKDLAERNPVIRLKQDAARTGVDKWVKQLEVVDVTANHINDANELHNIVQVVTGINDNMLGQFYTGRRSATENRNTNSAAASRLKMPALLIFRSMLEPMARKMLSNLQQGLSMETYVRVVGELADPAAYQQFVKVTQADLVGEYDFQVFDGTLPSERIVQAQAIEDLLVQWVQNPQSLLLLGYDPTKLFEEWLELRGVRNPKRFLMDQVRTQQLIVQMAVAAQIENGQIPGQPAQPTGAEGGVPNGAPASARGSSRPAPAGGARNGG